MNTMTSQSREDYVKGSPSIPDILNEYTYQVGGHGIQNNKKYQILNDNSGILYKPVQYFPKGEREIKFYQMIFNEKCVDPVALNLRKFIPKYIGIFSCKDPSKENLYIAIEDLLFRFKLPSVADVKIGRISYEPDVPPEKKKTEIEKYKWRETVGFLITGIKINAPEPIFFDRYHGRSLNPDQVYTNGIKTFLGSNNNRAISLADKFIMNLKNLLDWFLKQNQFGFIASSILMAYENGNGNYLRSNCNEGQELNGYCNPNVMVKLIDFTHVSEISEPDDNCIYAIQSLIKYFNHVKSDYKY